MTQYNYSRKMEGDYSRAVGRDLPISTKHSVEVCRNLRGMKLTKAKSVLAGVIALKSPLPYRRFNRDLGHKPGMGPGRYPVKTAQAILALLSSVEANAQAKGLNTAQLGIVHICAHQASRPFRYGRHRGRLAKRTHVEVIVKEIAQKKKETKKATGPLKEKQTQKMEKKTEKIVKKKQVQSQEEDQAKNQVAQPEKEQPKLMNGEKKQTPATAQVQEGDQQ